MTNIVKEDFADIVRLAKRANDQSDRGHKAILKLIMQEDGCDEAKALKIRSFMYERTCMGIISESMYVLKEAIKKTVNNYNNIYMTEKERCEKMKNHKKDYYARIKRESKERNIRNMS